MGYRGRAPKSPVVPDSNLVGYSAMDSLLANYASSDEEQEDHQPTKTTSSSNTTSSLFSSLPQPKSSPTFQSIPQPKQPPSKFGESPSLFSSLPKPKSQIEEQHKKKIVQFKPPVIPLPKSTELEDEDDIEEEKERNRRRKLESSIEPPSVKSFLSSIPAPRNTATLGVQSSSGSGRRSIVETEAPPEPAIVGSSATTATTESEVPVYQNAGDYVNYENYPNYQYGTDQNAGSGFSMDGASYGNYDSGVDQSVEGGTASYGNGSNGADAYAGYSGYGDYGQFGNNWVDGVAEASGVSEDAMRFPGKKRGRHEIPSEVIEVKQEELIKNRPREDQVKLTGIAFGPSYQPVSAKGKPTKLHKRKHQIGSLLFDMKQNEMKLAERRAKGMLTKAETQAKYGW